MKIFASSAALRPAAPPSPAFLPERGWIASAWRRSASLEPETSTNYSVGLAITPMPGLSVTVGAYRIELRDRIALTGLLSGSGVASILTRNGFPSNLSARYFANAIDTNTTGLDIVGSYAHQLGDRGRVCPTPKASHPSAATRRSESAAASRQVGEGRRPYATSAAGAWRRSMRAPSLRLDRAGGLYVGDHLGVGGEPGVHRAAQPRDLIQDPNA
ncbi:TonB-dependent receptor domain-containing protein [Phenylobacterium sp.]|uniref:TonB-dependent receptor domain-containing protein n=1 Tax=Phenylobacterium sp. TaxID=1871053 RepID=UPI002FC5F972